MNRRPALPVPSAVGEIDAAWLSRALRSGGKLPDGRAVSVAAEVIGEELGFTGVVARVHVTYVPARAGPPTVVAKLPTAQRAVESDYRRRIAHDAEPRRRLAQRAVREARFYGEIASAGPSPAPRLLFAAIEPSGERVVLLLEDMIGARQPDLLAGMTDADAGAVLCAMAPLHARWWASREPALSWLPNWASDAVGRGDEYATLARPFLDRYGAMLPRGAAGVVEGMTARFGDVLHRLAAAPQTVVHADLHADNVLIRPWAEAPDDAVVVDWQTVAWGPAALDASLLLTGSMTTSVRRTAERGLLERYLRALRAAGVTGYSFDELLRDYRLATQWQLTAIVRWLARTDPASLTGRERLIVERLISEPRVFLAAVEMAD